MIIQGTVLGVERVVGQRGENKWDYFQAHVLEGVKVWACRIGDNWQGGLPTQGEVGAWEVELRAFVSRAGQAVAALTLLAPAEPFEAAPGGKRAAA
jgi:hypothetical protein